MIRAIFFILPFLILSCKEKTGYVSKNENNGDAIYSVESEDEEMNKAIINAQKTYNDFLRAFQNPDSLMSDFAIKMRFDYGASSGEHMWLGDLYFESEKLFGILNNDPVEIKTVKLGDTIEIIQNNISDWMYLNNNKLVGGYTIKVLYNKMSPDEKKEREKQLGIEIE